MGRPADLLRLGLVAYADNTGLGSQTQAYFDHLKPLKTMVLNREGAKRDFRCYPERMPGATVIKGLPTFDEVDAFLDGLQVVLMAENSPTEYLLRKARELGVKTVTVPNWEYFHNFQKKNLLLPDLLMPATLWHFDDLPGIPGKTKKYLPFPVEVSPGVDKPVEGGHNFVHIAGMPIAPDRNGTESLLKALPFITGNVKITIFCQEPGYIDSIRPDSVPPNVELVVRGSVASADELYADQHVLVMPRRFGGLCLPVNEALGRGLPVIMPDISPNNQWLPAEWLVPAQIIDQRKMSAMIDVYDANPAALAHVIDLMSNPQWFAAALTDVGYLIEDYSWGALTERYIETLSDMV